MGAEAELALVQLFPLLFRELTFNDKYWICKENELLQLILYFRLRLSILNIFQKNLIKIEQNKLTKVEATCCSSLNSVQCWGRLYCWLLAGRGTWFDLRNESINHCQQQERFQSVKFVTCSVSCVKSAACSLCCAADDA